MRNVVVISVVVFALLFMSLYGACTIAYSRLLTGMQSHRNADEYLGATEVYYHDCFIELPMGIAIRGEPDRNGILEIGVVKLPISKHEVVGWLLLVASLLSAVALAVYLWRWMPND